MTLAIGSLFSGIGGLELGLERAGLGPVLWQAESDPFCQRVLAEHWPNATRYDDVRQVDERAERPGLICGGFPCQGVSVAGKGLGLADPRSGLWSEYARIVGALRPRCVVVENVPALVTRGLDRVLGDLATLGYDAVWDGLPAAAVGAPHRRDRLFVVAWRVSDPERDGVREQPERGAGVPQEADGWNAEPVQLGPSMADAVVEGRAGANEGAERAGRRAAVIGRPDVANAQGATGRSEARVPFGIDGADSAGRRAPESRGRGVSDVANSDRRRRELERGEGLRPDLQVDGSAAIGGRHDVDRRDLPQWPPAPDDLHAWGRVQADAQPAVCRVAHGIPDRAHRLRALGNAVVPQVAEVIGRAIMAAIPGDSP